LTRGKAEVCPDAGNENTKFHRTTCREPLAARVEPADREDEKGRCAMSVKEERMTVAAPTERRRGVRGWLVVVIGAVALAAGALIGALVAGDDEDSSELGSAALTGEPTAGAVEIVEQWGAAWESGDSDAVLALYSSDVEERYIVDQTFRAVWRDVEAAIDQINSVNDFDRFDVVRIEEFPTSAVAEYEVQWAPEGDAPADQSNVVVVFIVDELEGGRVLASDIYVLPWVNLFGVDYESDYSLGNGGWAVIDN
jgi:hypothetical protein